MKNKTFLLLLFILSTLQSFADVRVEETIAYQTKNEVWEDFRNKFPFHIQTIGLSEIEKDKSLNLIIAEPPPHITRLQLDRFFANYKYFLEEKKHSLGIDGWVKDVSIIISDTSTEDIEKLIKNLSKLLYHTSYKAYALDLAKTHLNNSKDDLNYQITAAELDDWLMVKKGKFKNKKNAPSSLIELFNQDKQGVFYGVKPGLVAWLIPKDDISESEKEARKFAIDTDLILGAVASAEHIAIIGRERELSIHEFPPLRTEMIMMLANANNRELSQSYERNQLFAGKLDNGKDWAPIHLSDELKHTEYGSLLNITDQLLKSWSQNGETDYESFNYFIPQEWPFEKPLSKALNTGEVTFNWNTKGGVYLVNYGDHEVTALNRTGALPISYFPDGLVNEHSEQEAREMEEIAYDYYANQHDPNLIRVVQYTVLYQIFSEYDVGCLKASKYGIAKDTNRKTEQKFFRETNKILHELPDKYVPEIEQTIQDKRPQDTTLALLYDILVEPFKINVAELKSIVDSIEWKYGQDGMEFFSHLIANARDLDKLEEILKSNKNLFDKNDIIYLADAKTKFLEKVKGVGLSSLGCDIEKVYLELISIHNDSGREWMKTPTILISWNVDSLISIGGHNIDSRVTYFRVDETIKPGECKVYSLMGNKVVVASRAGIANIDNVTLKKIAASKSTGTETIILDKKASPIRERKAITLSTIKRTGTSSRGFKQVQRDFNAKKRGKDYVKGKNGKVYKITKIEQEKFVQHPGNENILFPSKKVNAIAEITAKMRKRTYAKEEINVISLVEDFKTSKILDNHFGNRNLSHNIKGAKDLTKIFQQNNRKSFVVFGHIEGGKFSFGKSNNFKLSLSEIEMAAKTANVNVFFFGCKSSFANQTTIKTGVANNIYSAEAASRLGFAINKNKNTWGLFNDLAYKDVKIILTDEPLGNLGFMEAKLAQKKTVGAFAGISSAGVITGLFLNAGGGDEEEEEEERKKNRKQKTENKK